MEETTEQQILKFLKLTIEKIGGFETNIMTKDSHLFNDLGLDSLDIIELIMKCENEYKIKIPLYYESKLETINDVIKLVLKKIDNE